MGKDPGAADNRWLKDAMENKLLSSYFSAYRPGTMRRCLTFVVGWDHDCSKPKLHLVRADQFAAILLLHLMSAAMR